VVKDILRPFQNINKSESKKFDVFDQNLNQIHSLFLIHFCLYFETDGVLHECFCIATVHIHISVFKYHNFYHIFCQPIYVKSNI
jgi:hypothetical protein